MKENIDWATRKESEKDPERHLVTGAGKGDKRRDVLSKYEEGYEGINWRSNEDSKSQE